MLIYKTFLSNKNFFRYLFLISLLLISFLLVATLSQSVSNMIFQKNNNITNRKILIELNENIEITDLKVKIEDDNNLNLEKITKSELEDEKNNEYEIVFKNYTDVEFFKENYSEYYNVITFFGDSIENQSVLFYLKMVLSIASYIFWGVLLISISIAIIELFLDFIPDISLLKLLNFSNNLIISYLLKFFFISFLSLYFIICLLFKIIIIIINKILKILSVNFVLYNLNFQLIIMLYITSFLLILIIVYCIYFKLKKITPISFIKKSLSL